MVYRVGLELVDGERGLAAVDLQLVWSNGEGSYIQGSGRGSQHLEARD